MSRFALRKYFRCFFMFSDYMLISKNKIFNNICGFFFIFSLLKLTFVAIRLQLYYLKYECSLNWTFFKIDENILCQRFNNAGGNTFIATVIASCKPMVHNRNELQVSINGSVMFQSLNEITDYLLEWEKQRRFCLNHQNL